MKRIRPFGAVALLKSGPHLDMARTACRDFSLLHVSARVIEASAEIEIWPVTSSAMISVEEYSSIRWIIVTRTSRRIASLATELYQAQTR